MGYATRDNIGRRLGVLFIEYKTKLEKVVSDTGELDIVSVPYVERHIISLATIQAQLGKQFRITGLDGRRESSELALLLRAGALAAPMYIVEERTIGPSLGADNIDMGVKSVTVGMEMTAEDQSCFLLPCDLLRKAYVSSIFLFAPLETPAS